MTQLLKANLFRTALLAGLCSVVNATAHAQSRPIGHLDIAFGVAAEKDGFIHSIDVRPGLSGVAPTFTSGGGFFLAEKVLLDGHIDFARAISRNQSVRVGLLDFADTEVSHRDSVVSGEVLFRTGRHVWLGGGLLIARSTTERVGVAHRYGIDGRHSEPYATRTAEWRPGFVGNFSVRGPVGKSIGVMASLRVCFFDHNSREEGFDDGPLFRPTVGLDYRF